MSTAKTKDVWDKLSAASGFIASLVIPIVVAIVANSYTNAMKESENRVRYIEIAIGILKGEPSKETNALRIWAINVINQYSIVPITDSAQKELLERKLNVSHAPDWSKFTPYFNGNTDHVELKCSRSNGTPCEK